MVACLGLCISEGADAQIVFFDRFGPEPSRPLNDTGSLECRDEVSYVDCPAPGFEGQDAEYGRDALADAGELVKIGRGQRGFDFSKIGVNGEDLPVDATDWACTRDNVTGLLWEQATQDGTYRGRDQSFTWYEPRTDRNGGHPGSEDATFGCVGYQADDPSSFCNTRNYVAHVNEESLCGLSNWRLPSAQELKSIASYRTGYLGGIGDDGMFKHLASNAYYWSSTPLKGDPQRALIFSFPDVGIASKSKGQAFHVMLVSDGEQP